MANETTKIVVLGGGYAGVMAALRIAGKTKRLNTAVMLSQPLFLGHSGWRRRG
jgi:succinate dehydrogenase/fumarate reductase flavoprotein subunit